MSHTAPQAPDTLGCCGFGWVRVFPISEDGVDCGSDRRSMGRDGVMDGMDRRLASTVSLSTCFCSDWMFVKSSGIFFMLERRLDKSNGSSSGGSSRQVFQYRWVRTGIGKDSRPVVVNGGATTSLP